ncbi:Gfo/Idh/MocA family oxidoreductase [Ideonella sp. DXS29W]|uniref:Gfo/Idh/MocA family oxidoreductase n=1 Tax=Ideonella lacteola TaxID=2984193 RepID=A0ABU9BKW1_9BURK
MKSSESFGWCLVGPGRIAHRFAEAVHGLPGTHLAVVHGRDPARAEAFAQHWTRDGVVPVAATDRLDEALARPDVHGVYVATPHSFHGPAVRAALMAGKAVLCEKPMVASAAEAQPLIELARQRRVFLMEAVWTRFLPLYRTVGGWLRDGAIGPLRGMQSSFCFRTEYEPHSRMYDPALAGGALLDIGIYNLTMTRWALQQSLGTCPEPQAMQVTGRLAPTGVDQRVWAMLDFGDGLVSQFTCGFDGPADNGLRIAGERGHIVVPRTFWEATEAELHVGGEAPVVVRAPLAINGFEGEIDEVVLRVRAGEIESPVMPLDETLATLGWMDRLRAELGVRYPFE